MKNTFIKHFEEAPKESVESIVEKYNFLNDKIDTTDLDIVIPEVVDASDDHIVFKKLPIDDATSIGHHMKTAARDEVEDMFLRLGEVLAGLHSVLQPEGYVHGDFAPNNTFIWNDKIMVIDFEPSNEKRGWEQGIYNDIEHDLAHFIVSGESRFPHGHLLNYQLNRASWYREFLRGYRQAGGQYDGDRLFHLVRERYRRHLMGVFQSSQRTAVRKAGAASFGTITWLCNPLLR